MPRVPLAPAEPLNLHALAEIARGGMGSVELARVEDGRLAGQLVAIKRLHPNIAADPQFVAMFLDEAWLTAALEHPNVVRVAAWGTDDRGMFLAIEFVRGVSLARLLKESKQNKEPFAERTVANLCSQICAGLTAAHDLRGPDGARLGLVHRDLTPGNVLARFDGVVKIVDFGIAKAEERITHTRTGMLKGKPAYMAPEQARGGNVDLRADIFSFGVMMFELLAGRRPWTAKGAFDVMMDIAETPPPDLRELRPGLNPEFIAIVEKCLAKKPDDRFASTAEIQARLDAWRAQKGFTRDDEESLANFVVRNSTAQIKWFEDVERGDVARAAAPSFKELEEKIDADRAAAQPRNKPAAPRPAAGRAPASSPPAPFLGDGGTQYLPVAPAAARADRPSGYNAPAAPMTSGFFPTGSQLRPLSDPSSIPPSARIPSAPLLTAAETPSASPRSRTWLLGLLVVFFVLLAVAFLGFRVSRRAPDRAPPLAAPSEN